MLAVLIDWARRAGLARLRIEPEVGVHVRPLLASLGFHRVGDVQPSHTRVVRIASDTEMLTSFRRTTRYNIGYAERNGVTVDECGDANELALQVRHSAARAGVNMPGSDYFEILLERMPACRIFVARHQGESLGALLVAIHDGRGYYLYSGSSGRKRNLKPMDLAMWRAMQYAARSGCRDYDLWGIAPDGDPSHPWRGFSEFKRGYGGEVVEYAGTWDLALSASGRVALMARERAVQAYRRVRAGARRSFI
jgi:lipid II:glycine glycyltransferase (peptidoglycan interpeptide bridge formation enzyme)